jgi:hypothetical protein
VVLRIGRVVVDSLFLAPGQSECLITVAYAGVKLLLDLEGGEPRLRPLDEIPEEVRRCISSIKETADGFRVSFHSLHPALDPVLFTAF